MPHTILRGDCREVLAQLADASVDSVVCDPPYHLTSIVKRFGSENAAPAKSNGATGVYQRASRGFMGQTWDGGDVAFQPDTWAEVLRVLKPGGHLAAFGGTRTYHRLACAIEDAGFEIRDQLGWVYGSGFPKSLDVSKAIDKAAGPTREVVGVAGKSGSKRNAMRSDFAGGEYHTTAAATPDAAEWQGWGTALKPSWEPICLARKPLAGTVAANVLEHGTGALNIDGCRIEGVKPKLTTIDSDKRNNPILQTKSATNTGEVTTEGRWPANIIHDGSDEVLAGFPDTETGGGIRNSDSRAVYGSFGGSHAPRSFEANGGSAARFFYCAKAGKLDRLGSDHPTVKPVALMRWLVRLITPPGGLVLDPFCGSGSTGIAAFCEGFDSVLVELRDEAADDAQRRLDYFAGRGRARVLELARKDDAEKQAKARGSDLPLFS